MGVDDEWPDAEDIVCTVCGVGRAGGDKIKGDPEGVFNEATEMPPPLPGTTRLLSSPDDALALLGVDIIALEWRPGDGVAVSYASHSWMLPLLIFHFEVISIRDEKSARQCLNDHVVFSSPKKLTHFHFIHP